MRNRIETPKISEILFEEFMKPYGISAYKLAKDVHVPVSRIQDILHERRRMSADTSLRLAKYFGVSDDYFLNIQNEIDMRNTREQIEKDIESIIPFRLPEQIVA
ncbi:MAG: HigA family addiction module antidote protein [Erysipelotrichaceae bacterium]|nr:HigA family addiction module antidote protein [Erysipelotrichaceae bacterium]